MPGRGSRSQRWSLTEDSFTLFLSRLSSNREEAGAAYENIRLKLLTFFRCNAFQNPEDLVDQTIDRAIRRLGEIEVREVTSFVLGVARYVRRETRKTCKQELPLADAPELR